MSDSPSECSFYAQRLGDLLASLPVDNAWGDVEDISRKLANALRNRNGLGKFTYDLASMLTTNALSYQWTNTLH